MGNEGTTRLLAHRHDGYEGKLVAAFRRGARDVQVEDYARIA
jgi:hypothetical protein